MKEVASVERKKREYSKTELIFGNFAIVVWILLGTAACWMFLSFGALLFFALAAFFVFYELGKKGCVNCFFCKTCTIGMGKLPDLFFTKTTMQDLNINRKALKFFPFVYTLLSIVPIVLTAISIFLHIDFFNIVLLLGLLVFSVLTGVLRRTILLKR
jgi:hypothetical protein